MLGNLKNLLNLRKIPRQVHCVFKPAVTTKSSRMSAEYGKDRIDPADAGLWRKQGDLGALLIMRWLIFVEKEIGDD